MEKGKIIILSAPSGSGKSTIISHLMANPELSLGFSISATSRAPRGTERDGVEYYFMTDAEFLRRVEQGEFIEYEEVYPGTHYGTLASEVERVTSSGRDLLLDIDVKGAINVKRIYGSRAIALFIMPPSIDALRERLQGRATDAPEQIERRLAKARYELSFAPQFDKTIVNDLLPQAVEAVTEAIKSFSDLY